MVLDKKVENFMDRKSEKLRSFLEVELQTELQRSMWNRLVKRRKKWIGHLTINNIWIMIIIERRIDGKTGRGKPKRLL